jgi:hypothetical protein
MLHLIYFATINPNKPKPQSRVAAQLYFGVLVLSKYHSAKSRISTKPLPFIPIHKSVTTPLRIKN